MVAGGEAEQAGHAEMAATDFGAAVGNPGREARAYRGAYPDHSHRSQAQIMAADADAIAYLERQARNAAKVAGSTAADPETRERAVITRQCAERWANDLRTGMHHGEAEAWAAVLAESLGEPQSPASASADLASGERSAPTGPQAPAGASAPFANGPGRPRDAAASDIATNGGQD